MNIIDFIGTHVKKFVLICVLLIIVIVVYNIVIDDNKAKELRRQVFREQLFKIAEQAYFEGQRDYMNGDVRVRNTGVDDCYIWVKSPWDDNHHTDAKKWQFSNQNAIKGIIMDYKILTANNKSDLTLNVHKHMKDGYKLQGGISISITGFDVLYAQAMVKY